MMLVSNTSGLRGHKATSIPAVATSFLCIVLAATCTAALGDTNLSDIHSAAAFRSGLPPNTVGSSHLSLRRQLAVAHCGGTQAPVARISAGDAASCALLQDGSVYCWGRQYRGRLGNGAADGAVVGINNTADSAGAVPLVGGARATQVQIAQDHACALLDTGEVQCWGESQRGQLGHGLGSGFHLGTAGRAADAAGVVPIGGTAVHMSVGRFHVCVVLTTGDARCWGDYVEGRAGQGGGPFNASFVGDDEPASAASLIPTIGGASVLTVSAGRFATCMLLVGGNIQCFGGDRSGILGFNGGLDVVAIGDNEPANGGGLVGLMPGRTAVDVTMGGYVVCALLDDGRVQCWGRSPAHGSSLTGAFMLGDDEPTTNAGYMGLVNGSTATFVTCGSEHCCVILAGGDLQCWGVNRQGQLGYGHTTDTTVAGGAHPADSNGVVPMTPGGGGVVMWADGGEQHTCAVLATGQMRCWGSNEHGQLGLDDQRAAIGDDEPVWSAGYVTVPVQPPPSCSPSPSPSAPPSNTPSRSATPSGLISNAPTPSGTPTASSSASATAPVTGTPSVSPSAPASASAPPSASVSPTASTSPAAPSPSVTPEAAQPYVQRVALAPNVTPPPPFSLEVRPAAGGGAVDDSSTSESLLLPFVARGYLSGVAFSMSYVGVVRGVPVGRVSPQDAEGSAALGTPPTVHLTGDTASGELKRTEDTVLRVTMQLDAGVDDILSAVRGGRADEAAQHEGVFVFLLQGSATHNSAIMLRVPLVVSVKLAAAVLPQRSLVLYATASGTAGQPLTGLLPLQSLGSLPVQWSAQRVASTACWLSLSAPGAPPMTGDSVSHSVAGARTAPLMVRVDLAQLVRGIISTQLTVTLGGVVPVEVTVPVLVYVSSLQACPSVVRLPPVVPAADAQRGGVALQLQSSDMTVRNLGSVTSRVYNVAVLPGRVPVGVQVDCDNPAPPATAQQRFQALTAGQPPAPWLVAGDAVQQDGVTVPVQSSDSVPLVLTLSDAGTPVPGVYNATIVAVGSSGDPGDPGAVTELVAAYVEVSVGVGAASAARSVLLGSIDGLRGDQLPLLPSGEVGLPLGGSTGQAAVAAGGDVDVTGRALQRAGSDESLQMSDGILVGLLWLRDGLGARASLGDNVAFARVQVLPANVSGGGVSFDDVCSGADAASTSRGAVLRPLTGDEQAIAAAWYRDSPSSPCGGGGGLPECADVLSGTGTGGAVTGVLLPYSVLNTAVNGGSMHVSVCAGGRAMGSVTVRTAAAPCSGEGVVASPTGLTCVCQAGWGLAPGSSAADLQRGLSGVRCQPCGVGRFGPTVTLRATDEGACLPCGEGAFAWSGSTACVSCTEGTRCSGGKLTVVRGYGVGGDAVSNGSDVAALMSSVTICPYPLACRESEADEDGVALGSCRAPHEGALCGQCADGFTYSSVPGGATMQCVPCGAAPWLIVAFVTGISLSLVFTLVYLTERYREQVNEFHAFQSSTSTATARLRRVFSVSGPGASVDASRSLTQERKASLRVILSHARLVSLWLLMLHMQWSSLITSYRQFTDDTASVAAVAPASSIVPVHTWFMACAMGRDAPLRAFLLALVLPLLGGALGYACGWAVWLFRGRVDNLKQTAVGGLVQALFLAVPPSLQLMLSSGLVVPSGQGNVLASDFSTAEGSPEHVALVISGVTAALVWLVAVLLLSAYVLHDEAVEDHAMVGENMVVETLSSGMGGTVVQLVRRSIGAVFARGVMWFVLVWMWCGVSLALVAGMSVPPLSRAFAAGVLALGAWFVYVYGVPYGVSVPGTGRVSSAHAMTLHITGLAVHFGVAMQGVFTYTSQAWEAGVFFSGGGGGNPYVGGVDADLPTVVASTAFFVNTGFWVPVMCCVLTLLFPLWLVEAVRIIKRIGHVEVKAW